MARKLANQDNVTPPDSDFPYGRIKDDPGDGEGTPVDENVYGDMHQFFARLLAKAGITANGLPDNAYTGFQLFQALEDRISQLFSNFAISGQWTNLTLINGWVSGAYGTAQYRINSIGVVEFRGSLSGAGKSSTIFAVMPVGARPSVDIYQYIITVTGGGGAGTFNTLRVTSASGNIEILNDGGTFYLSPHCYAAN